MQSGTADMRTPFHDAKVLTQAAGASQGAVHWEHDGDVANAAETMVRAGPPKKTPLNKNTLRKKVPWASETSVALCRKVGRLTWAIVKTAREATDIGSRAGDESEQPVRAVWGPSRTGKGHQMGKPKSKTRTRPMTPR